MEHVKQLFVIGGPNGSGKTTSALILMPELVHCYEYINADAIAASLSPFIIAQKYKRHQEIAVYDELLWVDFTARADNG